VQKASRVMSISGGIRFLPVYGRSGSGKSSAARELSTHLPETKVLELSRSAIVSEATLLQEIREARGGRRQTQLLIAVIDQYEGNNLPDPNGRELLHSMTHVRKTLEKTLVHHLPIKR
jgi:ABC-type glutathione transport system ATPase component